MSVVAERGAVVWMPDSRHEPVTFLQDDVLRGSLPGTTLKGYRNLFEEVQEATHLKGTFRIWKL